MGRSILSGFGVAAVLLVAACSPDQATREPLAPTVPLLARSSQCSGSFASDIVKEQKELFSGAALDDLSAQFSVIKGLCPDAMSQLMTYLQSVVTYGAPTTNGNYAQALVNHWSALVLYVTDESRSWPASVLMGDATVAGVPDGGAKVLFPGDAMTTFDGQAGLELPSNPTSPTSAPHLFTWQPVAGIQCDNGTALRVTGKCYDVSDYPDGGTYSPPATITLCLRAAHHGQSGIGHARAGFGTEVLPPVDKSFSCSHDETALNGWLGRNGGPLGRALAQAYDYVRPRTLFADDAGVSASIDLFSLVGGVLNDIFADDFNDPADFNDGVDAPDLGDAWTISASSPGYVRIQDALGDLSGGVVVLSQALGNCANCPVFRLLGTRVNSSQSEAIGTYEVSWQSLQNKPSVKEAPFVVLNASNNNNEIARLSYMTMSGQNRLIFTVRNGNQVQTRDVGSWVRDVHQDFTITVNLNTLDPAIAHTVSLSINDIPVADAQNIPASRATSLKQIGYVLTGIDAGIIASDNWLVTRLADIPPQ